MLLDKLFSRLSRREGAEQTDYETSPSASAGLEAEYQKLVSDHLRRLGVPEHCAVVEARQLGSDQRGQGVFVAVIRLAVWERAAGLRMLLGLPLLEKRVRRVLPGLWFAEVSRFEGIWLHAGGQLQEAHATAELRKLLLNLTGADASTQKERRQRPI